MPSGAAEELIVDVAADSANSVTAEISRRRGVLHAQSEQSDGSIRLIYHYDARFIRPAQSTVNHFARHRRYELSFYV